MNREAYVKPVVMQLHYATEPDVAIAQACKTTGSQTGPTISSCRRSTNPGPCQSPGS
jgi:hypothetical protein